MCWCSINIQFEILPPILNLYLLQFYPARITASTDTTYVVQFKGYGNIEEVLKSDVIPNDQERGERKKYHKGKNLLINKDFTDTFSLQELLNFGEIPKNL